ncbi:nuclear transport factor 2 family protein [Vibrio diabolicus]|uniref:nuclear transport factor 2 family protein n=1 Tax=Vibrio diabolicus TaxID=50719 RepID=UPI00211AE492|nr:nuclear transport factor 2 family protein [Vibrio diabolicus]MCG6222598.1 nuclear transport factor 2 family protein [Vibrio diabolicus]
MDLQENKRNAIAFYETAYRGNPKKAVEDYVGDEYIQHNPLVGNGPEARYTHSFPTRRPPSISNKDITFVRAIAEGNLVALHTHQTWPNDIEYVTMDFFRFDHNGKIVEHWDALQEIPKETLNGHTMY